MYPVAECELDHRSPFELLAATILSAQCTDARVNLVTPALFRAYPTPEALAGAALPELEAIIQSTGFYQSKARNLVGMARGLLDGFGGEVPTDLDDLVTLTGVGRKTGNVVRAVAFGLPGLPVDTHVGRVVRRLGITDAEDPVKVELALHSMLPRSEWSGFGLRAILHGRRVCEARRPRCADCAMAAWCPSSELPRGAA